MDFLLGANVFVIVFVVVAILTLLGAVKMTAQGYHWTVERFGRYTRTLSPGLNLITLPGLSKARKKKTGFSGTQR